LRDFPLARERRKISFSLTAPNLSTSLFSSSSALKQRERKILIKKPQISETKKGFALTRESSPLFHYIENEEFSIYCSLAVYRKILSSDKKLSHSLTQSALELVFCLLSYVTHSRVN